MINPSFEEFEKIDKSRYAIVTMVSKRARRIVDNKSKALIKTEANKPVTQAVCEIVAEKVVKKEKKEMSVNE